MLQLFKYLLLTFGVCLGLHSNAQKENLTISIEVLADSMKLHPKPVMILVSTNWCKYCQMQKAQLLRNKAFSEAKDVVYFSELNAETKEDILFNGQIYQYKNSGDARGIHELAIALADKKEGLSYPLWIILDQNYKILLRLNGLLAPDEVKKIVETLSKQKDE